MLSGGARGSVAVCAHALLLRVACAALRADLRPSADLGRLPHHLVPRVPHDGADVPRPELASAAKHLLLPGEDV